VGAFYSIFLSRTNIHYGIKIMKIRDAQTTDTGIVIDPDDDVDIIQHINFNELLYEGYSIYCNAIYPYNYD